MVHKTIQGKNKITLPLLSAGIIALLLLAAMMLLPAVASATLSQADRLIVIKSKRLLLVLKDGEILKTYKVALGKRPDGHKTRAGDNRTPEGTYLLDSRNANSNYHRALHISYPNEADYVNAHKRGVSPGGDIMIHGLSARLKKAEREHRYLDWTNGCIAVTDNEIEELWRLVPDGTPIEIRP